MRRMTKKAFLERMERFLTGYETVWYRPGTCPGREGFSYCVEFAYDGIPPYRDACYWCRKLFTNPEEAAEFKMIICPCSTFRNREEAMANARKVLDKLKKKEA